MRTRAGGAAARQRGTVLMVVLVALVAMMISVIALSRSTDTNPAVHSSDAGVLNAVQWLQSTVGTPALNASDPARGYFATVIEANWDDPALWTACAGCQIAGDAAGNTVQWLVHRMCSAEGNPNDPGVSCSLLTAGSAAASGGSYAGDATNFTGNAQNYYRVTVRVVGPRNTSTLVQAFVSL
jgi:type IV pilus assembly protein PilX